MATDKQPLVTVLTPVYNGEDYLVECIDSVLKQTYDNFEYIIVNNCSKDRTLEIARTYAAMDSRVRVHDNEKFVPVIANHNIAFGLMLPDAKYCKVVSADDFLFPDCIQQMVDFAEANPSVGYVGAYQLSGSYVKWQGFKYPTKVFKGTELCRWILLQEQLFLRGEPILGFGSPTSLLYRSDLVRRSPEFYPNPSPHSDTSACFRDLAQCDFGFLYQILSFERIHEATQTSTSRDMNRHLSAYLSDLIDYGRFYLSGDELRDKIDEMLRDYHRFLASNIGAGRGKAFWDYHEQRLKELGYPLTRWALLRGAGTVAAKGILDPFRVVRKIRNKVSPKPPMPVAPAPGTLAPVAGGGEQSPTPTGGSQA